MAEPDRITLRRAELRDVHGIMAIDRRVYPTPWSEQLVMREVRSETRVHLVAEHRFGVMGHGALVLLGGDAHITTIAVDPEHQGRGLGYDLLLSLLRGAVAAGSTAVTLEVRSGNEAALGLYRRFGMRPAGVRRGYYSDTGEDALVLWSPDLDEAYRLRLTSMLYENPVVLSAELESWNVPPARRRSS